MEGKWGRILTIDACSGTMNATIYFYQKGFLMRSKDKSVVFAYLGIIAVIFAWGLIPSAKKALIGDAFSASVYTVITTFSAALVLLILSAKSLKRMDRSYFKLAIPTGLCVGAASLAQALAYNFNASPVNQAFLENISCIVVPVLLFIFIKKRPRILTVIAAILCLLSSFILTGMFKGGSSFCTADILNALAGVFYGLNIALTGIYAKKYVASLYVMIQLFVQSFFSLGMAVAFHFIKTDGVPIDAFRFTADVSLILAVIGIGILTNAICWTIRTSAMKYVSPTAVAIIMPFSSVITGFFAVAIGQDTFSPSLAIGAVLGFLSCVASGFGELEKNPKESAPRVEDRH